MTKIGFLWRRGNIEKEQHSLNTMTVESELQDTDLYKICRAFEKVMERPKKIKEYKKLGRPRRSKPNPLNF